MLKTYVENRFGRGAFAAIAKLGKTTSSTFTAFSITMQHIKLILMYVYMFIESKINRAFFYMNDVLHFSFCDCAPNHHHHRRLRFPQHPCRLCNDESTSFWHIIALLKANVKCIERHHHYVSLYSTCIVYKIYIICIVCAQ